MTWLVLLRISVYFVASIFLLSNQAFLQHRRLRTLTKKSEINLAPRRCTIIQQFYYSYMHTYMHTYIKHILSTSSSAYYYSIECSKEIRSSINRNIVFA